MQAPMSRNGACRDNAQMESGPGTLKSEHIHHRRFASSTKHGR